jgi:hypothetical protein
MGSRKPKAYTFTKNAGLQLTFCQMQSPWIILFFNDEFLSNITATNRYARHKIVELHLSLRSNWSRWSDASVPEVEAFLGLIINMGLNPLPDIKDYWSSEKKTQNFLVA